MTEDLLTRFLLSVAGNPKILTSHISLFSAILCCRKCGKDSFNINRRNLMKLSKIRSTATYHKCIWDLIEIGFVLYQPSFDPLLGSEMTILN